MHDGYEDFRFIHFNMQAVRNEIVNGAKTMTTEFDKNNYIVIKKEPVEF